MSNQSKNIRFQTNYMIKYFLLTLLLLGAVYAQGNQCDNSCDPYNRCDLNTTTGFYECQAGTVSYNGSCYLCDLPGCSKCYQDNFCIQFDDTICSSGQSVDIYGQSCISCNVNNCQRCDTPDHCARCDFDYTQVNGACSLRTRNYRCPSWCNACQRRGRFSLYCPTCTQIYQKPNPSQNQCYNCGLANCRFCDSEDSCTVCEPGYRKQAYWVSCNGSSGDSQNSGTGQSGSDRSERSGRGRNLGEDKGRDKKFRCVPI